MAYIDAVKDGEMIDVIQQWFYNSPRNSSGSIRKAPLSTISQVKSIVQGDSLMEYLTFINKLSDADITTTLPPINLFGLKLTILSPDPATLQLLRNKYHDEKSSNFEQNEESSISEAKAPPVYDYEIPLTSFNLSKWNEDNSKENGSSISMLSEFDDKRILWLADAHPNIVIKSLENLGYSKENPLICDIVKIAHHGSKGNNSSTLYEMITCSNYLISANGENRSCLPTKECIARILRNPNRLPNSHYNFYTTYDNKTLRDIFKIDGEKVFEEFDFSFHLLESENKYIEFKVSTTIKH